MTSARFDIYTDGACLGNPGRGGWAFVVYDHGRKIHHQACGGEADTTNNRMELRGAIEALEYGLLAHSTQHPWKAKISTDSQYVQKGILEWMPGWIKSNWRGSGGKIIKNQDLWARLHELNEQLDVQWAWVRGHSGNAGNEKADELATSAARMVRTSKGGHVKSFHNEERGVVAHAKPGAKKATKTELSKLKDGVAAPHKVILNVPFAQKDAAKKAGARWDAPIKKWVIPTGSDMRVVQKFLPDDMKAYIDKFWPRKI